MCYKAEHTESGTNVRFLVTNLKGRSRSVFAFYNDRGECENRVEEFKSGFAADRLSCHRFRANAFRLLLHSFAYNLVNLFRLQFPSSMRSAQIETLRIQLFKIGARVREQPVASVFTWLAAGLFRISSKPPAIPLRLSRLFDNKLSEVRAELFRKCVLEIKRVAVQTSLSVDDRTPSFPASPI
jgi:hypothetical protein